MGCFDGRCKTKIIRNNTVELIELQYMKHGDRLFSEDSTILVEYILKTRYMGQQLYKLDNLIGTGHHPIYDNNSWIFLKDSNYVDLLEDYDCEWLYSISAIEIKLDGTFKNTSYFYVENIKCATFGHGYLNALETNPNYSILSSTFWGYSILYIIRLLINSGYMDDNILILDDNYEFIRDDNGWCIGLELNGMRFT